MEACAGVDGNMFLKTDFKKVMPVQPRSPYWVFVLPKSKLVEPPHLQTRKAVKYFLLCQDM